MLRLSVILGLLLIYIVLHFVCFIFVVPVVGSWKPVVVFAMPLVMGIVLAKVGSMAIWVAAGGPAVILVVRIVVDDVTADWLAANYIGLVMLTAIATFTGFVGFKLGRSIFNSSKPALD
jgi:hypothetical protein